MRKNNNRLRYNKKCRRGGGRFHPPALLGLRTCISCKTRQMLMIEAEESGYVYNKLTPSRKRRDSTDKEQIVSAFQRFNVFREGVPSPVLQNIANKNLASESIQHSLLNGWQLAKWKRVFLTCPCHEIYRDEAVGLKSCKNTWKITIFVKMWNLGQYRENLIFCQ